MRPCRFRSSCSATSAAHHLEPSWHSLITAPGLHSGTSGRLIPVPLPSPCPDDTPLPFFSPFPATFPFLDGSFCLRRSSSRACLMLPPGEPSCPQDADYK